MSAQDLLAVVAEVDVDASLDPSFGGTTVDVKAAHWSAVAQSLRDDPRSDLGFFDWLSAYDADARGLAIVVRAWSVELRHAVMVRTFVEREGAELPSLTPVWAGADWHERETFEMFGLRFSGHPHLVPLLLPDGFEGTPLRKEFVLAARVAKDWPGAKEPEEAADAGPGGARRRKPIVPPGVPAPGTWGSPS